MPSCSSVEGRPLLEFAPLARAFPLRCQRHQKRESRPQYDRLRNFAFAENPKFGVNELLYH